MDIDECLTDNGGCHADATCTNSPGSRSCKCNPGYEGDGVGPEGCADISECLINNGGCHKNAACINTKGKFIHGPVLLIIISLGLLVVIVVVIVVVDIVVLDGGNGDG